MKGGGQMTEVQISSEIFDKFFISPHPVLGWGLSKLLPKGHRIICPLGYDNDNTRQSSAGVTIRGFVSPVPLMILHELWRGVYFDFIKLHRPTYFSEKNTSFYI